MKEKRLRSRLVVKSNYNVDCQKKKINEPLRSSRTAVKNQIENCKLTKYYLISTVQPNPFEHFKFCVYHPCI